MKIMFVCLGNICRSPAAHAIMEDLNQKHHLDLKIESSGIQADTFEPNADPRMIKEAAKHGIHIDHKPRQFKEQDIKDYDLILVTTPRQQTHIQMMAEKKDWDKIKLLGLYDKESPTESISDPWYNNDFDEVFAQLQRCCDGVLRQIRQQ